MAVAALVAGFLVLPGIIAVSTLQYETTIHETSLPVQSSDAVYDPSNGMIYVSSLYKGQVYGYNSSSFQLESTISLDGMFSVLQQTNEIFDPHNGMLYVAGISGLAVINTTTNAMAATINFGYDNFTQGMVLGANGDLYVSQGMSVTVVNGSRAVGNYTLQGLRPVVYNDDVTFAQDPGLNTVYLVLDSSGQLMYSSSLSHLNLSNVRYGQKYNNPTYVKFQQSTNQLLIGTTHRLHVVNPSNVSDTIFTINLVNSAGGVKAVMYSSYTNYMYISTYGSQAIYAYNDTTGSYVGAFRQSVDYNTPTGIVQVSPGRMAVSAGSVLILENELPSNLSPNMSALGTALAISATVIGVAAVTVYASFRRRT